MDNPIEKFKQWWQEALTDSPLRQKSAVCISTIDPLGFPTGRFVDLKSADADGFTFCTSLESAKGQQLRRDPKAALTVWWDHVGYQVRVIGFGQAIPRSQAEVYWKTRNRSAQLTTAAFEQSQTLAKETDLDRRTEQVASRYAGVEVPKPDNWGGFLIQPMSIEFLTFRESRLHLRELYEKQGEAWNKRLLQP